jgi:hypothetical protein
MSCSPGFPVTTFSRRLVLALLLPLAVTGTARSQDTASVDPGTEPWSVLELLRYQAGFRDSLQARDVYKLLFQASMGVEHLLTDTAAVGAYLEVELAGIDSQGFGEPLLERISPDGGMVRVNLRPFRALNLPPRLLVKAMFASAAETLPDTVVFYSWWATYVSLVHSGVLGPAPADLGEWVERLRGGDLVAAHHSPAYERRNRPAYRVVRRSVILPLLNSLGIP